MGQYLIRGKKMPDKRHRERCSTPDGVEAYLAPSTGVKMAENELQIGMEVGGDLRCSRQHKKSGVRCVFAPVIS